jgi:hypothetical protein|tara:strand:- start:461 stop:703 length:243 start_codon:yes stop_codon:yes gene_type:complete
MLYYILYPGDNESDMINDINQLGEQSFKVFWASTGFNILQKIINETHEITEHIIIKDEKGNSYSIEEFLDKIKKLEIRTQ